MFSSRSITTATGLTTRESSHTSQGITQQCTNFLVYQHDSWKGQIIIGVRGSLVTNIIVVLNIDSAISTTEITPKDLSRSYITNLTAPSVEDPIDSSPGQLPAVLLRIQPPDIYQT
jgi:hypothetical protein